MTLVLDASVALPWFFADEKSDVSDQVLIELYRNGAVVPVLWPIEVGNALTMGLRRGRLREADWRTSLSTLAAIPVTVEPLERGTALAALSELAKTYNLTFYDALYLEMADRLKLPLATFDRDLIAAAPLAGVRLWTVP